MSKDSNASRNHIAINVLTGFHTFGYIRSQQAVCIHVQHARAPTATWFVGSHDGERWRLHAPLHLEASSEPLRERCFSCAQRSGKHHYRACFQLLANSPAGFDHIF